MKLDIKTLFVGLTICMSYAYVNNNRGNELVTTFIKPTINVVTLSY